jgi:hypothetical protein
MIFENFAGFVPPSGGEPLGRVAREARHFSIAGIFDKVGSSGLIKIY